MLTINPSKWGQTERLEAMKPIDAVWKIIGKVVPNLTPHKLFQGLLPDYDPNLSADENKKRMAKTIASGKFGDALAKAAQKYIEEPLSQEEAEKAGEEVINIYQTAREIENQAQEEIKSQTGIQQPIENLTEPEDKEQIKSEEV
ncbi:MAG: hypothetical protein F6K47_31465 [Symploca sp. SIO2E6]|nr:hypothetical protein [Symploca sp. SIO2E6]